MGPNFMCWGPKEADVIGKIERTLKWRDEVSFIFGSGSKWTVRGPSGRSMAVELDGLKEENGR